MNFRWKAGAKAEFITLLASEIERKIKTGKSFNTDHLVRELVLGFADNPEKISNKIIVNLIALAEGVMTTNEMPSTIYLQVNGTTHQATWCKYRKNSTDIEYEKTGY